MVINPKKDLEEDVKKAFVQSLLDQNAQQLVLIESLKKQVGKLQKRGKKMRQMPMTFTNRKILETLLRVSTEIPKG